LGDVEQIHIVKEADLKSKGCAFVKYRLKEHALIAIRDFNGQVYISNSDKPLEVRFAEGKNRKFV